ncbi:uncharacterized protein [Eleutherodactylus coqui]|uniref:uncharacterized protein n=1 Tax=Eleutherodactylus coqui TaxID=57060 RepID=UPI003461EE39
MDLSEYLPDKPLITYKRGRNLGDRLVHSHLTPGPSSTTWLNSELPKGSYPCSGCKACKFMRRGTTFTSSSTGHEYNIREFINCRSSGVVYKATCHCPLDYVGKTIQQLRRRVLGHIGNIDRGEHTSLATHIREYHNNDPNMVRFQGIETIKENGRRGENIGQQAGNSQPRQWREKHRQQRRHHHYPQRVHHYPQRAHHYPQQVHHYPQLAHHSLTTTPIATTPSGGKSSGGTTSPSGGTTTTPNGASSLSTTAALLPPTGRAACPPQQHYYPQRGEQPVHHSSTTTPNGASNWPTTAALLPPTGPPLPPAGPPQHHYKPPLRPRPVAGKAAAAPLAPAEAPLQPPTGRAACPPQQHYYPQRGEQPVHHSSTTTPNGASSLSTTAALLPPVRPCPVAGKAPPAAAAPLAPAEAPLQPPTGQADGPPQLPPPAAALSAPPSQSPLAASATSAKKGLPTFSAVAQCIPFATSSHFPENVLVSTNGDQRRQDDNLG